MQTIFRAIALILLLSTVALGHETAATSADISLDEKLGGSISLDAVFRDENGKQTDLKSLIDKPVIIAPVYFKCMHECPLLLMNLARTLGKMDLVRPGRDYRVIALSFDDTDTPAVAAEKKPNYLKAIGKPFPEEDWKFLTGDAANIRKFTGSIGFTFQRDGSEFSHPLALVVVAPGGKIVRYLYGGEFLPFEVTMALTEASEGRVGTTAQKVLRYCFSYDPLKKSYVFNILKVTGAAMVLFVGSFLAWLVMTGKRKGQTKT